MYKKDYILNEAEKLALVIAKLMGLKAEDKADEFIHLADSTLRNEYNISLEELLELTIEDFKLKLEKENNSADKLDALAQLLYVFNEPFSVNPETLQVLQKVIIIFDLLEQKYHLQSFENITKRNLMNQFINRNYE
jgi:transcriptional regulator with XRE-family HTH domain